VVSHGRPTRPRNVLNPILLSSSNGSARAAARVEANASEGRVDRQAERLCDNRGEGVADHVDVAASLGVKDPSVRESLSARQHVQCELGLKSFILRLEERRWPIGEARAVESRLG
jgi:hypothetical protein